MIPRGAGSGLVGFTGTVRAGVYHHSASGRMPDSAALITSEQLAAYVEDGAVTIDTPWTSAELAWLTFSPLWRNRKQRTSA